MEFDLKQLRRDWIEGVPGQDFYARVMAIRASLEGRAAEYIIREEDPIAFAEKFFAAVSARVPTVLASPKWGFKEEEQFIQLMSGREFEPGSILIPTGGTTGGVKLAIHDWSSLCASGRAVQAFLGSGPIDSCCVLPLHHVSGLMQLVRSFVSGGCIRFNDTNVKGRCLSFVPTQLQRALKDDLKIEKLRSARVIFVGGAAMPKAVEQRARDLKLPIVPVYGMTETAAMIAAIPNEDFLAAPEAGAIALGDTEMSIDPDGSIRLRGSSLFKGYLGGERIDPSQGFRSGDAGWLDEKGRLHLQGRIDHLINSGGEKVDPEEVEQALLRLKGIVQARVVGEPDEEWGEIVVAYLRLAEGVSHLNESEIQNSLKSDLSPYKIPKLFRYF